MECYTVERMSFTNEIYNLFPPISSATNAHHDQLQFFNVCHLVLIGLLTVYCGLTSHISLHSNLLDDARHHPWSWPLT